MCKERSHAIVNIKLTFTETRLLICKRELLNVLDYIYRELSPLSSRLYKLVVYYQFCVLIR